MLNHTSDIPVPRNDAVYMWIYTFNGTIIVVVNFFIVIVIYGNAKLRQQKEYVIFAANMISDGLFGMNYLGSGLRRLLIFYSDDIYLEWYSRWQCFCVHHTIIFVISTPLVGIISFFTSLDRFFAVAFPARYYKWTNQYAFGVTVAAIMLSMPTLIVSAVGTYQLRDIYDVTSMCILNDSIAPGIDYAIRIIRISCMMTGLAFYAVIAKKVYKMLQPQYSVATTSALNRRKLKAMTITFTLITVNDIVFFVIPDMISFFYMHGNFLLYTFNCTKGIANIIIFLYTQKELRREITKVFWRNNASQHRVHVQPLQTRRISAL